MRVSFGLFKPLTEFLVSMSSYENENLEIYEHTNGQIMIRNITNVVIRSMDDLYALLNAGVSVFMCRLGSNLTFCSLR